MKSRNGVPTFFPVEMIELRGIAIAFQSRSRRKRLSRGQQRHTTKGKERTSTKQKQTRGKCPGDVSRRHSIQTMKNPTMKNNQVFFLEVALS